jgi:DNA-binding NarL/FixJ family response regulator
MPKVTEKIKRLIKKGFTDKEIAAKMNMSLQGIVYHISKLYRAAGLYGRGDNRRFMAWLFKGKT